MELVQQYYGQLYRIYTLTVRPLGLTQENYSTPTLDMQNILKY